MPATDQHISELARRVLDQHGDGAFRIVHEMISHLTRILDIDRADDWRRVLAAVEDLRSATLAGGG